MVRKELLLVPADWKRPCEMDGCMEKSAYIAYSAQMPKNMGIYLCEKCLNELMRAAAIINGLALVDPTKVDIVEKGTAIVVPPSDGTNDDPPQPPGILDGDKPNPYRVSDRLRKGARK